MARIQAVFLVMALAVPSVGFAHTRQRLSLDQPCTDALRLSDESRLVELRDRFADAVLALMSAPENAGPRHLNELRRLDQLLIQEVWPAIANLRPAQAEWVITVLEHAHIDGTLEESASLLSLTTGEVLLLTNDELVKTAFGRVALVHELTHLVSFALQGRSIIDIQARWLGVYREEIHAFEREYQFLQAILRENDMRLPSYWVSVNHEAREHLKDASMIALIRGEELLDRGNPTTRRATLDRAFMDALAKALYQPSHQYVKKRLKVPTYKKQQELLELVRYFKVNFAWLGGHKHGLSGLIFRHIRRSRNL